MPTPFTLGATSVTTTGTQFNYLASATGTTGTTSSNLVFSNSPARHSSVRRSIKALHLLLSVEQRLDQII